MRRMKPAQFNVDAGFYKQIQIILTKILISNTSYYTACMSNYDIPILSTHRTNLSKFAIFCMSLLTSIDKTKLSPINYSLSFYMPSRKPHPKPNQFI